MKPVMQLVSFYLVVQLIGLACLPLTRRVFSRLPDGGYAFHKALAVLLTGVALWSGNAYGLLRNDVGGAWLAVMAVGLVAWGSGRVSGTADWWRRNRRLFLVIEGLFFVAYAGWAVVRCLDPAVAHTEQPMDLMLLDAIHTSPTFPPHDAWLSGHTISYYYLGYWLVNDLAWLAGLRPEVIYNLAQAGWFALLLTGSFGVAYNVCALECGSADRRSPRRRTPLACGVLAALSVGVIGNLQVVLEVAHARGLPVRPIAEWIDVPNFPPGPDGTDAAWWWRSSRVVRDYAADGTPLEVITEFPAFSYVLGDDHPHVLAMPFALVLLGLALNGFVRRAEGDGPVWKGPITDRVVLVVCCGALLGLNAWDFPTYVLLLVVASLLATVERSWRPDVRSVLGCLVPPAGLFALLTVGTVVLYLPLLLGARSQVEGVALNLAHPTRLPQWLLMFGAFAPGVVALVGVAWRRRRPSSSAIGVAAAVAVAVPPLVRWGIGGWLVGAPSPPPKPTQLLTSWVVGLALAAVVVSLAPRAPRAGEGPPAVGLRFALLVAAVGLFVVLLPEFIYVRDLFGTRMNTVFKFYYQGWMLLAIASSLGLLLGWRAGGAMRVVAVAGIGLLSVASSYPVLAVVSKVGGSVPGRPTFDGLAHLRERSPDEWAAIRWVRDNVPLGAVVVEAPGISYHAEHNRMSTATGRATLLGWASHEWQWRGRATAPLIARRVAALETLYDSGAETSILETLDRWEADFVYVGPVERVRFPGSADPDARFGGVLDTVFSSGDVRLFARPGLVPR